MSRQRVSLILVAARIVAIVGMGFAAAVAIMLLVGGFWPQGLVFLAITIVFFGLMVLVERQAERS